MTSWGSTGGRKPAINVGMIGPRGSGKTTLASVITKVLAGRGRAFARTPEELEGATRRGVYYTGPNYHVEYEGATRRYIHYDQPGELARARVAGPRQLDVGVVVVAADGPVTAGALAESVTELRVAGVGAWLGFISKVELRAGARSLDATEAALREAMWTLGVDGDALTVIRGSARLVMEGERGALGAGAVLLTASAIGLVLASSFERALRAHEATLLAELTRLEAQRLDDALQELVREWH